MKQKSLKRVASTIFLAVMLASCLIIIPAKRAYAAAGEVNVTDSNIVWSPYSWVFSGSSYAQTPTTGSYLKVAFSGSTIALDIDTSMFADVTPAVIPANIQMAAYIDGSNTPVRKTLADMSAGELVFRNDLAAGNHYAQIYVSGNQEYTKRWGTTSPDTPAAAFVRITAIQLAAGDGAIRPLSGTPLAKKTPKVIFYGDSITEGNNIGTTFGDESYAADVGRHLNAEYSQRGYASLTWGPAFFSGTPSFHYFDAGTTATGVWRNAYKGQSLLVGGQPSGGYSDGVPDAVFNNMGINDYGSRGSGFNTSTDMKARIKSWLVDERTTVGARPAIFMIVPFNYGNAGGTDIPEFKSAFLAAITEYQSEHPTDKRVYTIDLGSQAYDIVLANSSDNLHPNPAGAALLADLINTQVGGIGTKIILDQPLTATLNGGAIAEGVTIDKTPTFSGTAPAGSTVTVTIHSDPITCTAVADASGNWTCTFSGTIPAGAHSLAISASTVYGTTLQLAAVGINVTNYSSNAELANTGTNMFLPLMGAYLLVLSTWAIMITKYFWARRQTK